MTDITDRLALVADERGVSEVIGAILVFGVLVMALTLVQTQLIPQANKEVEFQHNQNVQQDFSKLQSTMSRTSATGIDESVTMELGMTYPARMLFLNPPPVTGTLRTSSTQPVSVSNAKALNTETNDYVSGGISVDTRHLDYDPAYTRMDNAGTITWTHGAVVRSFDQGDPVVDNTGSLVDGTTISLTTIGNSYTESSVGASSVQITPTSAPKETVGIQAPSTNPNDEITVTLGTNLPEEVWIQEILAEEIDDPDGGAAGAGLEGDESTCKDIASGASPGAGPTDNRFIKDCNWGGNQITIVFQQFVDPNNPSTSDLVTYDLAMSQVRFGSSVGSTSAHYGTSTGTLTKRVPAGQKVTLTVDVRDKFNNPVSGADVEFQNTGLASPPTATSETDGEATVSFAPGFTGTRTITAVVTDIPTAATQRREVEFEVTNGAAPPVVLTGAEVTPSSNEIKMELTNTKTSERTITQIHVGHITKNDRRTDILATTDPSDAQITLTTSNLQDGPDKVTEVQGNLLSSPAEEHGKRSVVAGPVAIGAGSSKTVALTVAPGFTMSGSGDDGDSMLVSVTVYFDDGYKNTYTFNVYRSDKI